MVAVLHFYNALLLHCNVAAVVAPGAVVAAVAGGGLLHIAGVAGGRDGEISPARGNTGTVQH